MRKLDKNKIVTMRESLKIQGYDGNWNYDEYMHGMYNGMELMLAYAEGREPVYREKPEKWLRNKDTESKPIKVTEYQA